jgi:PPOX class probable F420-dependent enzyme
MLKESRGGDMNTREAHEGGRDARLDLAVHPERALRYEDATREYLAGLAYAESHRRDSVVSQVAPPADRLQPTPVFSGKYLSVTTFRSDGTGVATPVWFVEDDGRLLIETAIDSYKVRRIRRNPSVTVAVCTAAGRPRGEHVSAHAELLAESEVGKVERLMADKYRVDMMFTKPLRALQAALRRGKPRSRPVIVAITPTVA